MSENTLLEAALSYAKRGWHVFPCRPKLKVPLTTHGVKDATTDENTIKAWWTRWPDANIALACGEKSGVYVVDVDLDHEKNVDGWESLEQFPEMPMTVRQESPRGGAHFLFKTDNPPRNKNNFRNGIDIRSEGYYVMLTPSISVQSCFESMAPDGIPYNWAEGMSPDDVALAEFPDCFRPEAEKKAVMPWEKPKPAPEPPRQPEKRTESTHSVSIHDRAILYLRQCPPAVQGHGGHDRLLWAARAMVTGLELSRSESISLLWSEFNPMCSPPWNPNDPADAKDFERKVDEAIKNPSTKEPGWLLKEYGLQEFDVDEALLKIAEKDAADMIANAEKSKIENKPADEHWTEDMFNPPGFVGDLTRYILSTPFGNQPKLALVASLVAAGVLYGRKVKNRRENRTNLFGLAIGRSSSGKGAPEKVINKLFSEAGVGYLLSGRVSSDSAIEEALQESPVKLFMWDECGEFFKSMKNQASHAASIPGVLKELWSKADVMYYGKHKIDGHKEVMQNNACFWGAGTPKKVFGDGFDSTDIESGLLPRCVVAVCDETDDDIDDQCYVPDIPAGLIQMVQAWSQRTIQGNDSSGDIANATTPHQITIKETEEAKSVWSIYRRKCIIRMRELDKQGDDVAVMWGKAAENAARISLILACSERYDNSEVTKANMMLACRITDACTYDAINLINRNMHENVIAKDKHEIETFICGDNKGKTWPQISKKFRRINTKILHSYVDDMAECDVIDIISDPESKSKTKKPKIYFQHPYGYEYMLAYTKKQEKKGDLQ